MKKLYPIIVMSLVLLVSACTKPDEPAQISFSILGDSFSTFAGYVTPESNDSWYPNSLNNVSNVEEMWWHKLSTATGWTLDVNNSFSGSLICNYYDFNAGPYYSPYSFIRRMDNLGDPNVIFIFGGTNDVFNGAWHGDYVYSDWTEDQLNYYRPALAYMFDYLKRLYPRAKIYFLVDMWLHDYVDGEDFVESVHTIAGHYDIDCIDIYDIEKERWHPNIAGQATIAETILVELEASGDYRLNR